MLKYNKITKSVWNKIKKIIEKELDLKIDNNDSGRFTVKYVSIKYEYLKFSEIFLFISLTILLKRLLQKLRCTAFLIFFFWLTIIIFKILEFLFSNFF